MLAFRFMSISISNLLVKFIKDNRHKNESKDNNSKEPEKFTSQVPKYPRKVKLRRQLRNLLQKVKKDQAERFKKKNKCL